MVCFEALIRKFSNQAEKTGWTYIAIPEALAEKINPGVKKSYRVKGMLDQHPVEQLALLPMGDGSFIIPLNATLRKRINKSMGATVTVMLQKETKPVEIDADFLECLHDEPKALHTFKALPNGHRLYFSRWIQTAKTSNTKAKRIALAVNALAHGMGFPEMLRGQKAAKKPNGF